METPEYLKQQEKWQTRKQFNREKLGQRKMEELIYIRESLKDWHYPILAKKKKKCTFIGTENLYPKALAKIQ